MVGSRQTLKLLKLGRGKLVLVSSNCPQELKERVEHYCKLAGIKLYSYPGTGIELGVVMGKPYPVSLATVLDPGDSRLLSIVSE
ncbi:MAG: 50S ribosomal protein L30e [Candidatus Hadarchaeales archaeon]